MLETQAVPQMKRHNEIVLKRREHSHMKALIVTAALISLTTNCAALGKSELDAEVKRLCAIDGGIKVYEHAPLSSVKVDERGDIRIPAKEYTSPRDKYYFESETFFYRRGNPEMWRHEYRIIRANDKKVLGTSVVYTRRGGDLPSPIHDSSFSCPTVQSQPRLDKSIFVTGQ
jgi:hypothetical protein